MDSNTLMSGFIATILSLIVTILYSQYNQYKIRKIERKNLAIALRTEILMLATLYKEIELPDFPPKNGLEIKSSNISQNYISVYENNLDKIGKLKNEDISYVIELYLYFKYLIDSLKWLSRRWETYARYKNDNGNSKDEKIQAELKRKYNDVVNAYKAAKAGEDRIFGLYKDVFDRLSRY